MINSSNPTKKNERRLQEKYTVSNAIVNYFLVVMFTVFPLFFSNAYYSIRRDKYILFLSLAGIVIAVELLLILSAKFSTQKKDQAPSMEVMDFNNMKILSFTDCAILIFFVVSVISTIFSGNMEEAVYGSQNGRNNGLVLILFYVGIYFVITRCYKYMEYVFLFLAGGVAIAYLLSILNYFYIDPLSMYNDLSPRYIEDFTSTIGNKNMMSSFICVTLPVLIAFSVHTKKLLNRVIFIASSVLGFIALMTADSDSGILGIGAFVLVYFVWYSRRISRLKLYFLCLTVMLLFARLFGFIVMSADKTKEMDKFQQFFVNSNLAFILVVVLAVITAILFFIDMKKPNLILPKAVPIVLIILIALGVIGGIATVVYFSVFDTSTNLGSFGSIIRFNDKWGTHRGFMWIRSMWIFNDAPIFNKLFGTGPDTFYSAFSPYFFELSKFGDTSTNAAHNEYINYLITHGIFGLGAYLAIIGGVLARAIKCAKKNPLTIVFSASVICYAVQATVNIAQPITTPLFIVFIALTEAINRKVTIQS